MSNGPIRRAQLIAPFGVGSLVVVRDGISLIAAGLDHWYKREDGVSADIQEFKFNERRLSRQLGVNHFRQPPDYRRPTRSFSTKSISNVNLTIPFLRFPTWHSCTRCRTLKKLKLHNRGKQECPKCKTEHKYGELNQVPIIAMCEKGHLQDFPWREWVHKEVNPSCKKDMRLISTGGASLASQKIKCACGKERSLSRVTFEDVLSEQLQDKDHPYLCQGQRPWLGSEAKSSCGSTLRVSVRSASNVYYAHTASAIYIPHSESGAPPQLLEILDKPGPSFIFEALKTDIKPQNLRNSIPEMLEPFTDSQIEVGIKEILGDITIKSKPKEDIDFKREEFEILRIERNEDYLKVRQTLLSKYDRDISTYFSGITLIDKLRETRALYGFTRIFPENDQNIRELKEHLRRDNSKASWLPAYIVYGEGILIEFNEDKIQQWLAENGKMLEKRLQPLINRTMREREERELKPKPLSVRYFLVHTFAHILIRQLTFECGYSAASLRERLYVSDDPETPMAAVLIYTASGDAEGTMGGLVRMGKAGLLEPVIRKAVAEARWCSSDPVCMEFGDKAQHTGKNLAACHSCTLLPETSCETFNQFLDRALVVGDMNSLKGFFDDVDR